MATILLIEDSDVCAFFFRRVLEKAGYEVVVATTASDALAKVAHQTFDAALVDAHLPDGDGSALELPCPRIMMSADAGPGVLTKASDTARLVAAVRQAIAQPVGTQPVGPQPVGTQAG
jgi:DNA-binding response OmpR family regulator